MSNDNNVITFAPKKPKAEVQKQQEISLFDLIAMGKVPVLDMFDLKGNRVTAVYGPTHFNGQSAVNR